jgi:hypothetical protein
MPTVKTAPVRAMDDLLARLRPFLKERGFRAHRRTYNRITSNGLTHVIGFQMGRFDPPSTAHSPRLGEKLYGKFTINVGVYVPEVARNILVEPGSFVHEGECCLRERLGILGPEHIDLWWAARVDEDTLADLRLRLERDAIAFLARFETRDEILVELMGRRENYGSGGAPRIVSAIILANRGQIDEARKLLETQVVSVAEPRHTEYVIGLAAKMGLGTLEV